MCNKLRLDITVLCIKGGRDSATTIGVLGTVLPVEILILLAACAVPFIYTHNTTLVGAMLLAPLWLLALLMGEPVSLIGYSIGLPCLLGILHFLTTRYQP